MLGFLIVVCHLVVVAAAHQERPGRDADEPQQVIVGQVPGVGTEAGVAQAGQGAAGQGSLRRRQGGAAVVPVGPQDVVGQVLPHPVEFAPVALTHPFQVGDVLRHHLPRQQRAPQFLRRQGLVPPHVPLAEGLHQPPEGVGRAPRRLRRGQPGHLPPTVGVAAGQAGDLVRITVVGQVTGRQVLLKGAVRKGVYPHPARQEQSGPLAQVLLQTARLHVGVPAQGQQPVPQLFLRHIGRPHQVGLGLVGLVGQLVEEGAHPLTVHPQPFRQAGLPYLPPIARLHHFGSLPPVEQEVHRVGVQLLPFLRQVSAAPGVERGHQRQQQGTLRQGQQPVAAEDRPLEPFRPILGVVGVHVAQLGDVGVPPLDEAANLPPPEGRQNRLGEVGQPPLLLLIGVSAARHQHPAAGIGFGPVLHRLLDLLAASVGLRHLVQAVQEEQPPFPQLPLQVGAVLPQGVAFQFGDDEVPQVLGGGRYADGGQAAGGEVAQHHPHRHQRTVNPGLRRGVLLILLVVLGERSGEPFQVRLRAAQ